MGRGGDKVLKVNHVNLEVHSKSSSPNCLPSVKKKKKKKKERRVNRLSPLFSEPKSKAKLDVIHLLEISKDVNRITN